MHNHIKLSNLIVLVLIVCTVLQKHENISLYHILIYGQHNQVIGAWVRIWPKSGMHVKTHHNTEVHENCIIFSPYVYLKTLPCTFHLIGYLSYTLKIWMNSKYQRPLLYAMFVIRSFGGIVGPLIVQQFIGKIHPANYSDHRNATKQYLTNANTSDITDNTSLVVTDIMIKEVSRVRFSYVVVAAIVFVSSLSFVTTFIMFYHARWNSSMIDGDTDVPQNSSNESKAKDKSYYILMMLMLIFYYFEGCFENIPNNLLAVFTVDGLGWSNQSGALATSLLWGGNMVSQVLSTPLTMFMSPRHMIILTATIMASGTVLLLCVNIHMAFLWSGACMLGLGMGPLYGAGILWAAEYIEITGAVASIFVFAYAIASMSGPAFTGFLLDKISYMCFVYVLIGVVCLFMATYICAIFYLKYAYQTISQGKPR